MKKYYASTFIAALSAVFFASFGGTVFAATNTFNEKTIKQWSLKGPLTTLLFAKPRRCPCQTRKTNPVGSSPTVSGTSLINRLSTQTNGLSAWRGGRAGNPPGSAQKTSKSGTANSASQCARKPCLNRCSNGDITITPLPRCTQKSAHFTDIMKSRHAP
jgi:hypothetical protein